MRAAVIIACLAATALAQAQNGSGGLDLSLGREFGIYASEFGAGVAVGGAAVLGGLILGLSGTYSVARELFDGYHQNDYVGTNLVLAFAAVPAAGAGGTQFIGDARDLGGSYWATAVGAALGNAAGFAMWCVAYRNADDPARSRLWTVVPVSLVGLGAGALGGYNLSLWNTPGHEPRASRVLPPSLGLQTTPEGGEYDVQLLTVRI
jgi:hypothetical protein